MLEIISSNFPKSTSQTISMPDSLSGKTYVVETLQEEYHDKIKQNSNIL